MSDFLAEMVAGAHERVAAARERTPLRRPSGATAGHRLLEALIAPRLSEREPDQGVRLALIAEIKRRSPSKGDIAPALDAAAQAKAYEAAGADAISVLTEPSRFGGSLDDLRTVTAAVSLPVLRKDFIVDPYQIWEAADAGAAAVLLIVAALSDDALAGLMAECHACGLDALVEVHGRDELERALTAGARLVGVNNRNLRTLAVDLAVTEQLAAHVPPGVVLVSESGIATADDAWRAARAGAGALLVGEALVRTTADALTELVRALRTGIDDTGPYK